MTPSSPTEQRPLRRDAAANRDRVLAAASEVFDSHGLEAGVAGIAKAAGVGMGTLYRRFPTKDALIDALVDDVLDAMITMARAAAGAGAGTGLERFLEASCAYHAQHRGCLPRLWNPDTEMVRTARDLVADLLVDAQRHGRVRPEITTTDVTLIFLSVRGVLDATASSAQDAWHRHLDILVAGLRPTGETLAHPAVSQASLDRALAPREAKSGAGGTGGATGG